MGHGAKAWVSDFNHPHYMAGRKAMKTGTETECLNTDVNVMREQCVKDKCHDRHDKSLKVIALWWLAEVHVINPIQYLPYKQMGHDPS